VKSECTVFKFYLFIKPEETINTLFMQFPIHLDLLLCVYS